MQRVAIVTRGTTALGEAVALAFRNRGLTVAVTTGDEAATGSLQNREGVRCYRLDVSIRNACAKTVARIEQELGPVAILVNIAASGGRQRFQTMSRCVWQDMIDQSLGGSFNMVNVVWPGMQRREYGRIVNVGPIGEIGRNLDVASAAAATGLHGFTRSLAQEGGPAGITVNAVMPGSIGTDTSEALGVTFAGRPERLGQIAQAVAFCCAEGAGYLTGSVLSLEE